MRESIERHTAWSAEWSHASCAPLQVLDLNAVHVNPCRPWLFAVGGDDPFARVYDLRAMRNISGQNRATDNNEEGQRGSGSLVTVQCEPVRRPDCVHFYKRN